MAEAAADGQQESSIGFFAMDTYMSVRAWGASQELLEGVEDSVAGLEELLSVTAADSDISRLNQSGQADLSPETIQLLERALEMCHLCGGKLDISIYPLVKAWGFTTDRQRVPEQSEIAALLQRVDFTQIQLNETGAALSAGMEIDLGSLAKGYAGDRILALLKRSGVSSALLDLGGNIQTLGSKPDGSTWSIAIQDPEENQVLGVVEVADKAVITSGGYERCFTDQAGRLWWHILDPNTGYPAQSGLISVTIIGDEGLYCDALSTALFVMGEEEALAFWRLRRDFECILVTEDRRVLITPGLTDSFSLSDAADRVLQVVGEEN